MDKVSNSEAVVIKKIQLLGKQLAELNRFMLRGTVQAANIALAEEAITDTVNSLPHAFMVALAASGESYGLAEAQIKEMHAVVERTVDRLLAAKDYARLRRFTAIWAFVSRVHRGERNAQTCGAGINYMSVSTSGEFYICHRFTEDKRASIGNLKQGFDSAAIAKIQQHRLTEHAPCNTCWMREICAGGCYHENMLANSTAFSPDPRFCLTQDLLMRLAIRIYAQLAKDAPEALEKNPVSWRTEVS
jgi:uncharacterized protein